MYRQQEQAHTSSILETGLIKVLAGQKVRYAIIKVGVRRRHLEAPVELYAFRAHSHRPDHAYNSVLRVVEWIEILMFLSWHMCRLNSENYLFSGNGE